MPRPMPLNALRAFECAARHLSIREAAEELHVTPAAVSLQIKSLEEVLGVQLFHRLGRGLALTPAGVRARPWFEDGFNSLREGMLQIQNPENGESLNIWTAPSFASKWLIPRLSSFSKLYPEVNLRVTASVDLVDQRNTQRNFAEEQFRQLGIDVAIRFGNGRSSGCEVIKLMPVSIMPLCSPSLTELSSYPLNKPEDLTHFTLLHDDSPYEGRPDWHGWLSAHNVTSVDGHKGLRFNQGAMALQAAIEGQGVVLGLDKLAANDIACSRLMAPFSNQFPVESAYFVFTREEENVSSIVNLFRDWLLSQAGSAV